MDTTWKVEMELQVTSSLRSTGLFFIAKGQRVKDFIMTEFL
jgi:hypothetical protein